MGDLTSSHLRVARQFFLIGMLPCGGHRLHGFVPLVPTRSTRSRRIMWCSRSWPSSCLPCSTTSHDHRVVSLFDASSPTEDGCCSRALVSSPPTPAARGLHGRVHEDAADRRPGHHARRHDGPAGAQHAMVVAVAARHRPAATTAARPGERRRWRSAPDVLNLGSAFIFVFKAHHLPLRQHPHRTRRHVGRHGRAPRATSAART